MIYAYTSQRIHVVIINSNAAERIAYGILSANDEILAISIMDTRGNILAAISKDSFKEAFKLTRDGDKYGGTLAVAPLAVENEEKDIVGEAKVLIPVYKVCKMMLLPTPSYKIWVGFFLRRPFN